MPVSLPIFDDDIELYFRQAQHETVLDIGPGQGKYGRMLRRVQPSARLIGVEVDPAYVEQYKLRELYDEVWVRDAAGLMDDPRRAFSAVIIGDCIEHMRKSVGVDLLSFLVYRSRIIIVVFPVQMVQNAWRGHVSEAHLSVWSERDFADFDRIFVERDLMRLCLIRGYLSRAIEWLPPAVMRRFGYESVTAFYDEKPQRWKLADLDTRRRDLCNRELSAIIPPTARFILVDEAQSGLMADAGGRAIPFVEHDGQYWGMPPDDQAAVAEVERQRQAGAAFIVFAAPALWAMTHYCGLLAHLRSRYRCVLENDRLTVFDLRP
jgi:hypothetical protein